MTSAMSNILVLLSYVALCHGAWFVLEKWSAHVMTAVYERFGN